MSRLSRRQLLGAAAATLLVAGAIVAVSIVPGSAPKGRNADQLTVVPSGTDVITVGQAAQSRPIPSGFIGLSLEYQAVVAYAGEDPNAINPVLVQLIRNLAPGQSPVLRIGGDSSDKTWWPVRNLHPPGVKFTLTPRWLSVMRALAQATDARVIAGINLEADSLRLASAEARALVSGIGRGAVQALELGNEPELWGSFNYYRTPTGHAVTGRAPGYNLRSFTNDFARFGQALPQLPLAGPATGVLKWARQLGKFLAAEPRLGLVTLHRYPLQQCFTKPGDPIYPTIGHLLSPSSSRGLANSVIGYVASAHAAGLPLRIDEFNSVACGPKLGVTNTFASALWVLDTLFQMARVGVDGVNVHTLPSASYGLFVFSDPNGRWSAFVRPEYYGLLMFARVAPPGSVLLRTSAPTVPRVAVWATRAPGGRIRVVLINQALATARVLAVHAPGGSSATLMRLRAPRVTADQGVVIGGQSFGSQTTTGVLANERMVSLNRVAGDYVIKLPPASAALLTIGR